MKKQFGVSLPINCEGDTPEEAVRHVMDWVVDHSGRLEEVIFMVQEYGLVEGRPGKIGDLMVLSGAQALAEKEGQEE